MSETPKQEAQRKAVGLEKILNRIFNFKVIVNCDRDPYLLRWYVIRTEAVGLFIHKFVRSDEDRALHDHPWDFIVIPIWRGYNEWSCWHSQEMAAHVAKFPAQAERYGLTANGEKKRRVWPLIGTRFRRATYRHRVELIGGKSSWSIFIRFRNWRDWGFWPKDGFILNSTWWKERCD